VFSARPPVSVTSVPLEAYPEEVRRRLISNVTYNADGSINMETAERLGWTKIWAEQARTSGVKYP
jgi:hypothetical protein